MSRDRSAKRALEAACNELAAANRAIETYKRDFSNLNNDSRGWATGETIRQAFDTQSKAEAAIIKSAMQFMGHTWP